MDYDFSSYKHDVERFVSDLGKLATIKDFEINNNNLIVSRLQSINSLARALSAKTSFLRYLEIVDSSEDLGIEMRRHKLVPVIERVSYAAKHLMYLHHGKNVNRPIQLLRDSYGQFVGPDFFEFIPFAILDNSIKYNIRDGIIDINVFESSGKGCVDITSTGPLIHENERELIFNRGFRGREAIMTGKSGNGIGLYHAREATRNSFRGEIKLISNENDGSFELNGVRYSHNTFRIEVPLV